MRRIIGSLPCYCETPFQFIFAGCDRQDLKKMVEFLYSGVLTGPNQEAINETLCNLATYLGFSEPIRMKKKCDFCLAEFEEEEWRVHSLEEIEKIISGCHERISKNEEILCEICREHLSYQQSSNQTEFIKDHYHLHLGLNVPKLVDLEDNEVKTLTAKDL